MRFSIMVLDLRVPHTALGGPALAFPLRALLCLCAKSTVYVAASFRIFASVACVHTFSTFRPYMCVPLLVRKKVLSTLKPDILSVAFFNRIHTTLGSHGTCSPCVQMSFLSLCANVLSTLTPDVNILLFFTHVQQYFWQCPYRYI